MEYSEFFKMLLVSIHKSVLFFKITQIILDDVIILVSPGFHNKIS